MLDHRIRFMDLKHKEEKNRMLEIINSNIITNNTYNDKNRKDKKEIISQLVNRNKNKIDLIESDDGSLNNFINKLRDLSSVPQKIRTFIPYSQNHKVTNELIDIKEEIVNTFSKTKLLFS